MKMGCELLPVEGELARVTTSIQALTGQRTPLERYRKASPLCGGRGGLPAAKSAIGRWQSRDDREKAR